MKNIYIVLAFVLVLGILGITGAYFLYILPQQSAQRLAYDQQQDSFKKSKDCSDMMKRMQTQYLPDQPADGIEEWIDQLFYSHSKQTCIVTIRTNFFKPSMFEYQVLNALSGESLFDEIINPDSSDSSAKLETEGKYDNLITQLKQ